MSETRIGYADRDQYRVNSYSLPDVAEFGLPGNCFFLYSLHRPPLWFTSRPINCGETGLCPSVDSEMSRFETQLVPYGPLFLHSPLEVVVDAKPCLVFLAGVLKVDAAGEPQLMFPQAQFLERLFRRDQTEALPTEENNKTVINFALH